MSSSTLSKKLSWWKASTTQFWHRSELWGSRTTLSVILSRSFIISSSPWPARAPISWSWTRIKRSSFLIRWLMTRRPFNSPLRDWWLKTWSTKRRWEQGCKALSKKSEIIIKSLSRTLHRLQAKSIPWALVTTLLLSKLATVSSLGRWITTWIPWVVLSKVIEDLIAQRTFTKILNLLIGQIARNQQQLWLLMPEELVVASGKMLKSSRARMLSLLVPGTPRLALLRSQVTSATFWVLNMTAYTSTGRNRRRCQPQTTIRLTSRTSTRSKRIPR